jgi:hypothetical protein
MDRRHLLAQIIGHITDGVELGIASFAASFKMGNLGNGTATQHPNPQAAGLFVNRHRYLPRLQQP